MPFDPAALCYSAVRERYHDNPTEESAKGYQSQICRPLMHRLLMHRHRVWTGWIGMQQDRRGVPAKCLFLLIFSLRQYKATSAQPTVFSVEVALIKWLRTARYVALLGSYTVSCLIYSLRGESDITLLLRGERREHNAGTFETGRKMNSLHSWEKRAFHITLFKTRRHLNSLSSSDCGSKRLGHLTFKL